MLIPPIYHWSPRARRAGILRYGLVPGKPPTIGTVSAVHDSVPVTCFSTDPMLAWSLSGGTCTRRTALGMWDLWQTSVIDTDAVYVRSEYGPRLLEIRIANRVPKSRLKWVAERS